MQAWAVGPVCLLAGPGEGSSFTAAAQSGLCCEPGLASILTATLLAGSVVDRAADFASLAACLAFEGENQVSSLDLVPLCDQR